MARVSTEEAYDNRSVIRQIFCLKEHKQNKLTAGDGIRIDNDVISATGGGSGQHIYVGTEIPDDSLGENGDLYIRRHT